MDIFGKQLPSFNLKGNEIVKTNFGAALTLFLGGIVLLYAVVKFIQLESRENPNITEYMETFKTDSESPINLNSLNGRIAFSFEGYRDKNIKDDPRFVKWIFRIYGRKDGKEYEHLLPYHKCTQEEYDSFYPINPN